MQQKTADLEAKMAQRKRQFRVLMHALAELQTSLAADDVAGSEAMATEATAV